MTNHNLISDSKGLKDKNGKPFKFNCWTCDFHTNKSCNYTVHILCDKHIHKVSGTKKERKMNYCQFCPYKTPRPYGLKVHILTQHEKEKTIPDFLCDICNVGYGEIEHYKNHLETQQHVKKAVKRMIEKKEEIDLNRHQQLIEMR